MVFGAFWFLLLIGAWCVFDPARVLKNLEAAEKHPPNTRDPECG